MAGGKLFPDEALPDSYFQGGTHLYREPDDYPDLHELFNMLREAGGSRAGVNTVLAGDTAVVVTFATAYPTGTIPNVVATAQGQNVNVRADGISETGCTLHISGILGVDCDVAYIATA
jgi:hypothetical protein